MVAEAERQPFAHKKIRAVGCACMADCDRILEDLQERQDQDWYWLEKEAPGYPYSIVLEGSETDRKGR